MTSIDMRVPVAIANQPRPQPPDSSRMSDWENYYNDLACWLAMKSDVISFGIAEDTP